MGLEESAIAGGLGHGDHLHLCGARGSWSWRRRLEDFSAEILELVTFLWVLRESLELPGLLASCGEIQTSHLLGGFEELVIASGLEHGYHLQLVLASGSLGLGDEDIDPLVGLGSSHWLGRWLFDLSRVLGQLLGLDIGDQVVAKPLGAGIFWQGF